MTVSFGSGSTIVSSTWIVFETNIRSHNGQIQYEDDGITYSIYAFDSSQIFSCVIWKGTVPPSVVTGGYSQVQNDSDKSDFETNFKPYSNFPVNGIGDFNDPRLIRCFGNKTTTSTSEVLVSSRSYVIQGSQAQRSVQSSSVQDKPSGSGAAAVRITYLNSSYVLNTEDITLDGTTRITTVSTDIRFIEKFEVIQGTYAVGSISLLETASGAQTEFCGIAAGTTDAFLCHHYVPAGQKAYLLHWGANVDDEVNFKLITQFKYGSNLVDKVVDLDNLVNAAGTPPFRMEFTRELKGILIPEKTYTRITMVPKQATSTVTRAFMDLWEVPA